MRIIDDDLVLTVATVDNRSRVLKNRRQFSPRVRKSTPASVNNTSKDRHAAEFEAAMETVGSLGAYVGGSASGSGASIEGARIAEIGVANLDKMD